MIPKIIAVQKEEEEKKTEVENEIYLEWSHPQSSKKLSLITFSIAI